MRHSMRSPRTLATMIYIDAAAAEERALPSRGDGDVLIFMPSERDIRETPTCCESRYGRCCGGHPALRPA